MFAYVTDAVALGVFLGMLTFSGRRYAWGLCAIFAALFLLQPLGFSWLAAWLIGMAACAAVNSLPAFRNDPPWAYIAITLRALVGPLKARRAWWRVIRASESRMVVAFVVTDPENRAKLSGAAVPINATTLHGSLVEHRVEGFGGSWAIPAAEFPVWALTEREAASEGLRRAHRDRVPAFRSLQRQSVEHVTAVPAPEGALF